jgi:hypothetical protein
MERNIREELSNEEKGVNDATYQDFVAPILGGLGVAKAIPALLSKAPAVTAGLEAIPEAESSMTANSVFKIINGMIKKALSWGDPTDKASELNALKSMFEKSLISTDDALFKAQQIWLK